MRRSRLLAAALAVAFVAPAPASADSVFGIRGLGLLGRPLSTRALSTGGAFSLLDAASALNPAALAQFGGPVGFGGMAATTRRFQDGTLDASLGATRFPLFGFVTPVSRRAVAAVTVGEYLDRTWSVSTTQDTLLRDTAITYDDKASSAGGVSDLRIAGAYRLTDNVMVGMGFHVLLGSARQSIVRSFSDSAFGMFQEVAVTDYSGVGLSLGTMVRLNSRLAMAATARVNGRLRASAPGGTAHVSLPAEVGAGVLFSPVAHLALAASVGYRTWSRASAGLEAAGQPAARDVWDVSVGAESALLRWAGQQVPLRLGYRWRQLPFPVNATTPLSEHAFSAGAGLVVAGGRATLDAGVELGTRSAGTARERFTTGFVGLTVRP